MLDTTNYRYYAIQRIVDGILICSLSTTQQQYLIILSYPYPICTMLIIILICKMPVVFIMR